MLKVYYKAEKQVTRAFGLSFQYRLLCGRLNAQGWRNCRGEPGRLLLKNEGNVWFATPLVDPLMARDARTGWYRMTRQRRRFISGIEGGLNVGAGVTTQYQALDKQGQPLKMLRALYAATDRLVLVCPRCDQPNEVTVMDLVGVLERDAAPH